MILLLHAEVDEASKLDAQNVEVGVGPLDGGPLLTAQKRHLIGRKPARIGQQIPRCCAISLKDFAAQMRRRYRFVFSGMWIRGRFRLVQRLRFILCFKKFYLSTTRGQRNRFECRGLECLALSGDACHLHL